MAKSSPRIRNAVSHGGPEAQVIPDCPPTRLYVGDKIADVVPALMAELKRVGASITGTPTRGQLSVQLPTGGSIRGSWRIDGLSLAIEIKQRPPFVSCGQIESKLQDAILDAKNVLKQQQKSANEGS